MYSEGITLGRLVLRVGMLYTLCSRNEKAGTHSSIFHTQLVGAEGQWSDEVLAERWDALRALRAEVNRVLERARIEKLFGSSLEATVHLEVSGDSANAAAVSQVSCSMTANRCRSVCMYMMLS